MFRSKIYKTGIRICAISGMMIAPFGLSAQAGKAPRYAGPIAFDFDKRKSTKTKISDRFNISSYASVRYLTETELNLDDTLKDAANTPTLAVGIAGKFNISPRANAFFHLESNIRQKTTHTTQYAGTFRTQTKEAILSFNLTKQNTLSFGRMRLSDSKKWSVDASVDGIHFVHKGVGYSYELTAAQSVLSNSDHLFLFHANRFEGLNTLGAYAILGTQNEAEQAHLIVYKTRAVNTQFAYTFNLAANTGRVENDTKQGAGFDFAATYKFTGSKLSPQITYGFAAGSKQFQQAQLKSNKTYNGGHTQFNRYGYVFQPELTNLAVGTIDFGIRPSRQLSLDLVLHAYAQIEKSNIAPTARISGTTTRASNFVGTEASIVGAWRPSKKTKIEFGFGAFKPGPAYVNKPISKRAYANFSFYF